MIQVPLQTILNCIHYRLTAYKNLVLYDGSLAFILRSFSKREKTHSKIIFVVNFFQGSVMRMFQ